ncbi:unnamed protein product [Colias eurytheme]|nr:unnamed protein product [Colias eurytheme]
MWKWVSIESLPLTFTSFVYDTNTCRPPLKFRRDALRARERSRRANYNTVTGVTHTWSPTRSSAAVIVQASIPGCGRDTNTLRALNVRGVSARLRAPTARDGLRAPAAGRKSVRDSERPPSRGCNESD